MTIWFHPHPSPPAAVPPSPVRGKAPTLAVEGLRSSIGRRCDKPSPLAGEGGTRSVTDEGEKKEKSMVVLYTKLLPKSSMKVVEICRIHK